MYLSQEQAKEKILREKYNGAESDAFRADCARLAAHEPWEYVLGHTDFLDCHIDLSFKPMVPRDETAHWVARAIEEWRDKGPVEALDLYAGAGNIGIALLRHLPEAQVTFNEIDAGLLRQIAKSIGLNGLDTKRAVILAGDSFEKVTGTFDMRENINKIEAYINSKHISGDTDSMGREKPFFNIVTGIVNIWFRATDIDRKNIRIKSTKAEDTIMAFLGTVHLNQWMRKANFGVFLNDWGRTLAR
jgi:hypothetical protein